MAADQHDELKNPAKKASLSTFDDVFISERRDENPSSGSHDTGYIYTFRDPQGRKLETMAGRETFFVSHHNILFITWEKTAAATLAESLRDER